MKGWYEAVFATIGGILGWFLGGFDGFFYALVAFIVIDYITGVMCGFLNKKLSSEVGFRGIFKKVLILLLVGIGHLLDTQIIGSGGTVRTAIIFFYCANEGISILENCATIGLAVPKRLQNILAQLRTDNDEEKK